MLEVMPLKQAAGSDEHIDLPTLDTGNAQHLGDYLSGKPPEHLIRLSRSSATAASNR